TRTRRPCAPRGLCMPSNYAEDRGSATPAATAPESLSSLTVSESGDVEAIGTPLAQCAGQRAAHLHVVGKIKIVGADGCDDAFPNSVGEIDSPDHANAQY